MTTLMENLEKVAQANHGEEDLMERLEKVAESNFDENTYRAYMEQQRAGDTTNSVIGNGILGGLSGGLIGYAAGKPIAGAGIGGALGAGVGYLSGTNDEAYGRNADTLAIHEAKQLSPEGEFNEQSYNDLKDSDRSLASKVAPVMGGFVGGGVGALQGLPHGAPAATAAGLGGAGLGALVGAGSQYLMNRKDRSRDEEMINKINEEGASARGARSVSDAPAGEDKTANELMDHLEKTAEEFFFKKKDEKKDENCKEDCKDNKKEDKKDDKESEKEASELMDRLEKVAAGLKMPNPKGIKDAATSFKNDLTGKTTRTARTQAQNQLKAVGAGAAGATAIGAGIKALSNDSNKGEKQEKQASTEETMNNLYKEAALEILDAPLEKVAQYNDPINRIRF